MLSSGSSPYVHDLRHAMPMNMILVYHWYCYALSAIVLVPVTSLLHAWQGGWGKSLAINLAVNQEIVSYDCFTGL